MLPSELAGLSSPLLQERYRRQFWSDVAAGTVRPMIWPLDLFGPVILPVLYLSVPHARRPWLYKMRFAVMALIVYLNANMMARASSANTFMAYTVGVIASWSIMWSMALLVWTRPQFDAARVQTRPRRKHRVAFAGRNGSRNGSRNGDDTSNTIDKGIGVSIDYDNEDDIGDGSGIGWEHGQPKSSAPDESIADNLGEYEYYWQGFPVDGSFLTRLAWAADLFLALRGIGWNWSTAPIPHFQRPSNPHSGELVKLSSIPEATRAGYTRPLTHSSFVRGTIRRFVMFYLILDFCTVSMAKDPYFLLGLDRSYPPPSPLATLPPHLLEVWRSALILLRLQAILWFIFCTEQLARFSLSLVSPRLCRAYSPRTDLWQFPTIYGSLSAVWDHGLAGFWRDAWHQHLRLTLVSPMAWPLRRGWVSPRSVSTSLATTFIAFAQSGLVHTAANMTTVPRATVWWSTQAFFMLSAVGIGVQKAAAAVLRPLGMPLPVCRVGNLVFAFGWLHFTRWALSDDLSRAALWVAEPVPVSPLRALGFGASGDAWWRWDKEMLPRWYVGSHWWQAGLAM